MQRYLLSDELEDEQLYTEFVLQTLCLIETLQFAEGVVGSSLSVLQVHVLGEVSQGEKTFGELAALLNIEPATFSRIAERMIRQKFVVKLQSKTDGRSFFLRITSTGARAYEDFNRRAKLRYGQAFESLSEQDRDMFADVLLRVSEGFDYGLPKMRASDTKLRFALRCAARALGSIWGNFLGSKYSSNEATLLLLLWLSPEEFSIGRIRDRFGVRPSTLTRRIERFDKAGLVRRSSDRRDRRKRSLKLTRKGRLEFERFLGLASSRIREASTTLTLQDFREFLEVISRVNNQVIADYDQVRSGVVEQKDALHERAIGELSHIELLIDGAYAGTIQLTPVSGSNSFKVTGGTLSLPSQAVAKDDFHCRLIRQ